MKFQKTYCSQCGGEFGAGDEGFSSCADHTKGNRMIDAMKQALEAMEAWKEIYPPCFGELDKQAITALRQAIAEAEKESTMQEITDIGQWDTSDMAHRPGGLTVEQEPVAWVRDLTSPQPHCVTSMKYLSIADTDAGVKYIPVYTAPPKREWVGLTDEEIDYLEDAIDPAMYRVFARRIEAKLKEKNNG
jgi:hypothetical protein